MTRTLIEKNLGERGSLLMRTLYNFNVISIGKQGWSSDGFKSFRFFIMNQILSGGMFGTYLPGATPNAITLWETLNKDADLFKNYYAWELDIEDFPGSTQKVIKVRAHIESLHYPPIATLLLPYKEFLPQGFTQTVGGKPEILPKSPDLPRLKSIFNYILNPKLPATHSDHYDPVNLLKVGPEGLVVYSKLSTYIRDFREITPEQLIYQMGSYYTLKTAESDLATYLELYRRGHGISSGARDSGIVQCVSNPELWLDHRGSAKEISPSELLKLINEDPEPTEEELEQLRRAQEQVSKSKPPKEAVKTQEELEELEEIERSKRLAAMNAGKTPEELERIRLKNENDPWVKYKDAPDWACQIIEDDTTHEYPWPTELPKFLKVDPSRVPTRKELGFPHLADGNWEDGTRWGRMLRARYAAVLSLWGGAALEAMPNEVPNHEDYLLHKEAVIEYEAYKKAHPEEDL